MPSQFANCKALVFDLMGTCCDWHTSIVNALRSLPPSPASRLPEAELSDFALAWREGFFAEIHDRFARGLEQEDIDATHRRVLDRLLALRNASHDHDHEEEIVYDECTRQALVAAWHSQTPWPDAVRALQRLRERYFVVVLANGTTRLQLDIIRTSGLPFHMLFSSQLLGLTKPDPAIYRRAAELMGLKPEECVMVAAHAYDLEAARAVGFKTVYVRRSTEDVREDFGLIERSVDLFLDGRDGSQSCGLGALAMHLLQD